ncbi:alanine:cation symporter family protein [Lachnospiraceae bacterium C1.1]
MTGGPGAVFRMWIIAFFGMMTNYSENLLGIYYRRKNNKGEWCGGAMYYLRDGLGSYKNCKTIGTVLAVLFSAFCFLASFGIGNMTQVKGADIRPMLSAWPDIQREHERSAEIEVTDEVQAQEI